MTEVQLLFKYSFFLNETTFPFFLVNGQKKCYQCFGLGSRNQLLAQTASKHPISSCTDSFFFKRNYLPLFSSEWSEEMLPVLRTWLKKPTASTDSK